MMTLDLEVGECGHHYPVQMGRGGCPMVTCGPSPSGGAHGESRSFSDIVVSSSLMMFWSDVV